LRGGLFLHFALSQRNAAVVALVLPLSVLFVQVSAQLARFTADLKVCTTSK
jgi:hypothetical protein